MRYNKKFNKYERKEIRSEYIKQMTAGSGLYLYENSSAGATLSLPRPTKSGIRVIGPKQQFQGDDYYMQLVRAGQLRLIKCIQTPEEEQAAQLALTEGVEPMDEERLILDQPEIITEQGRVEHQVNRKTPLQDLNEDKNGKKPDVLINETPVNDGFMILE